MLKTVLTSGNFGYKAASVLQIGATKTFFPLLNDCQKASSSKAVAAGKPYSPFQDTKGLGEFVLARADDLINWGRKVTLFLVNVFITSAIILSGYDCLFINIDEFIVDETKKLEIFPQALCVLLSDWNDMLPKVGLWLQKLSKWKHLPQDRVKAFLQALLMLREVKFFRNENEFACLFNLFPLPSV